MEWLKLLEDIRARTHACGRGGACVQLIAVSKGRDVEEILHLYNQGQRDFGENRVQEVEAKSVQLPQDIRWHMIGTIQTKKVPKIIGRYALIHSVDSFDLAKKISDVSVQQGLTTSILLQVNVSGELSKHGFSPDALRASISSLAALPNLAIKGLMTMAPDTEDLAIIHHTFRGLKSLQAELQTSYPLLTELSMGMSHDYAIAIEEGATLLRIGTLLFQ